MGRKRPKKNKRRGMEKRLKSGRKVKKK